MKRSVVIIGANDFQNQLIIKAKEMGYETHVFAWLDGAVGAKTADYFYPISIIEKEKILEKCRIIKPVAVVSIASDLAVVTVNYLNEQLSLNGNGIYTTEFATNKYKMRECFKENKISTPEFKCVSSIDECDDIGLSFPLIVKPTDRSGSRGVTKVNSVDEMKKAVAECIDVSFEKKAIIEEFIEGEEFSAEFISYQGQHHMLAITKKFTTGVPHFIETGHMQPAQLEESTQESIRVEICKALDALKIRNGASHPEFKIDKDGKIRIIEVGARMGGDCIGSDLVIISTGYDFLKMTIQVACGLAPDLQRHRKVKAAFVRFIFSQDDLDKLKNIKKKHPEIIYRISDIETIGSHSVTDSSSRFGYYLLACDSVEQGYELLNIDD